MRTVRMAVVAMAVVGTGCAMAQALPPDPSASFTAYDVVSVRPSNLDGPHAYGVRPLRTASTPRLFTPILR